MSISATDIFWPLPVYKSINGEEMSAFYGPGWDRQYRIVGARTIETARACGLMNDTPTRPGSMFLPYYRESVPDLYEPGLIYRELLPSPGSETAQQGSTKFLPLIGVYYCNTETGEAKFLAGVDTL